MTPDRPFAEPWQAELFALTAALSEAGQVGLRDALARPAPEDGPQLGLDAEADAVVAAPHGIAQTDYARAPGILYNDRENAQKMYAPAHFGCAGRCISNI